MSGNFFSYRQNFAKGVKHVLRDMLKNLECYKDDKDYKSIYESTMKLYTNCALSELNKLYTSVNKFYNHKKSHHNVESYVNVNKDLNNVSHLFTSIFRDYEELQNNIKQLYNKCDESVCDALAYFEVLNTIAFPCPCNENDEKDHCLMDVCIPTHLYPLAFILWFIIIVGRILSGCTDASSTFNNGISFLIDMDVLVNIYEQFVRVGLAMKNVPKK